MKPFARPLGFAVLDVETTGLSPLTHRVIEIAVVQTDPRGRVQSEWVQRISPGVPVTATDIHGITDQDLAGAPDFAAIAAHLRGLLAGRAVAAHNASFDLAFLRAEFGRAGLTLPPLPTLCTLAASAYYLPDLTRRRLSDCCEALQIDLLAPHTALADTRACAALMQHYLDPRQGRRPLRRHRALPRKAARKVWA